MKLLKILLPTAVLAFVQPASAKLIQIIHTNDLHSFFEGSRSGMGGYSRIKTLVDQLKADAAAKNIPSLFLDGGDFGEGSSYYFSNKGADALRALDLLGIDATVMGNHDFFLGGKELSRQIKAANFKGRILSANLRGKIFTGLQKKIKPHTDFYFEGKKIRVFGLTTPELHFQYPLLPVNYISSATKKGIKIARNAKKDKVDLLIALTHLGLEKDMELVSKTKSLDLVIGGHSHTRLDQPKMVENQNGEVIPVFQTGAHGMAVGSLIIDVLGDGEYKLIDYRLYDVSKDIAENETVRKFVDEAYVNRERYFNRSWEEVIGFSEIPLTGLYKGRVRNPKSCWSRHIARITKQTGKTELGLQMDIFQGEEIPAGPIRFGDLIDNFPRFRKWGDNGWTIARARISGFVLNKVLKALSQGSEPLDVTIDGIQAASRGRIVPYRMGGMHAPEEARINGEKINNLRFYTISLPNELTFAISKLTGPFQELLLQDVQEIQEAAYWPLFEDYIRKNSPLRCLKD